MSPVNRFQLIPRRPLRLIWVLAVLCVGCEPSYSSWKPTSGEPLIVRVTGHEFQWHIRYPGPDRLFDTPDDLLTRRHIHLPANTHVRLEMQSRDYIYSLFLPHVDLVQIAVPDRLFTMAFETGLPATFELLGNQMCGFVHPDLIGELVVQTHRDFDDWLR